MQKRKTPQYHTLGLTKIVGGGQAMGTLDDGRKAFVWGGLPDELVEFQVTKKKSNYLEGVVTRVIKASPHRIKPIDPDSYLSTSPWQIMSFEAEQGYKAQLIDEAFELHKVTLPSKTTVFSNNVRYGYRNKVEYSFWFDTDTDKLSLAFFRRGTHGKIPVPGTSLASDAIQDKASEVLAVLNRQSIEGRRLKTLMVRSSALGEVAWQLYVKDEYFPADEIMTNFASDEKGEVLYSNPKSPASVITARLTPEVDVLSDTLLGVPFRYATEGFFQINLPVYEQALNDMAEWITPDVKVVDMYSGVGSIGLTIGGPEVQLVEVNESAVREMRSNIEQLGVQAEAVLAASENALDYIVSDKTIIVDPPRAGLHEAVVQRLLEVKPKRIIYLSCNPVTQARDVAMLQEAYAITHHTGYNFFPATPHIEHLVILDLN